MAANKPSEQNGTRLAKCLPDYTPHFLPDLCSSFRGSFPPRITKFNKNFLLQRVGNSSLKNAAHEALQLHRAESFRSYHLVTQDNTCFAKASQFNAVLTTAHRWTLS
jgi:hypothetical protein